MANKHMKRGSKSLNIREMQIENTVRYHYYGYHLLWLLFLKEKQNYKCWGECRENGLFDLASGNAKRCSHGGNIMVVPQKIKHRIMI